MGHGYFWMKHQYFYKYPIKVLRTNDKTQVEEWKEKEPTSSSL